MLGTLWLAPLVDEPAAMLPCLSMATMEMVSWLLLLTRLILSPTAPVATLRGFLLVSTGGGMEVATSCDVLELHPASDRHSDKSWPSDQAFSRND